MAIQYYLQENNLTNNGHYRAVVVSVDTLDRAYVVEQIAQMEPSMTPSMILTVLKARDEVVARSLLNGYNVRMPLTNFFVSLRGNFDGPTDSFDGERHEICPNSNPGTFLRTIVNNDSTTPAKQETSKRVPNPLQYFDVNTGVKNDVLTVNGMGHLQGHRLKYNIENPEEGVFFIDAEGEETRAQIVRHNLPSEITFIVPGELSAGEYRVEVRAAPSKNGKIRTGLLKYTLTVS